MNQKAEAVSSYSAALYHAVKEGKVNLARELLQAGADVNHQRERQPDDFFLSHSTPIMVAVGNDNLEMVKLLLKYNPNVHDASANGGGLPLLLAAVDGPLDILRTLLAHPGIIAGARESNNSYFALQIACENADFARVRLLVNYGEHTRDEYAEALVSAAIEGHIHVVRLLLEHGADVNHPGNHHFDPPLFCALFNGHWDEVRLMIRNGATLEIPFKCTMIRQDLEQPNIQEDAILWLSEDTTRTILCFKGLYWERAPEHPAPRIFYLSCDVLENWDTIVATLWFHYFGTNHKGNPPRIRDTAWLSDQGFKKEYKWMIHALSSLLYLAEGSLLLPHLCRVLDPHVALELSSTSDTGKTPLLLALEMFPRPNQTEEQDAATGTNLLIDWNPDALKVPHPATHRIPMTCAIVNRAPLPILQKMITCESEEWFTAMPKQQDPITLLPNYLLVAVGRDSYSVSDIYAFSRDFLPGIISSSMKRGLTSQDLCRSRPSLSRGIKRRIDQI